MYYDAQVSRVNESHTNSSTRPGLAQSNTEKSGTDGQHLDGVASFISSQGQLAFICPRKLRDDGMRARQDNRDKKKASRRPIGE